MTIEEILALARTRLDDWKGYGQQKELWTDEENLASLNSSYRELLKDTKCIVDSSTATLTIYSILTNTPEYPYDYRLVEIKSARIASYGNPLVLRDEAYMDEHHWNWRLRTGDPRILIPEYQSKKFRLFPYLVGTTDVTVSATFVAATKKITAASGLNIFSGVAQINIDGSVSNDSNFSVASVLDTEIGVSETLVNEGPITIRIRKIEDTVNLTIARLPLTAFTLALKASTTPELDDTYHEKLVHGIMKDAYLKPDAETLNQQAASNHLTLFATLKEEIKRDTIRRRHATRNLTPHRGMI